VGLAFFKSHGLLGQSTLVFELQKNHQRSVLAARDKRSIKLLASSYLCFSMLRISLCRFQENPSTFSQFCELSIPNTTGRVPPRCFLFPALLRYPHSPMHLECARLRRPQAFCLSQHRHLFTSFPLALALSAIINNTHL
jgi:hypothetical protein